MKFKSTLVLAAAIALMTPGAAFANTHTTSDPLGDMSSVGSPVPTASMDITDVRPHLFGPVLVMGVGPGAWCGAACGPGFDWSRSCGGSASHLLPPPWSAGPAC